MTDQAAGTRNVTIILTEEQREQIKQTTGRVVSELQASGRLPEHIYPVFLDYPIDPRPRYGYGRPPHAILNTLIGKNRSTYLKHLNCFRQYKDDYSRISAVVVDHQSVEPSWVNGFLPALDAIALYGFLCQYNPRNYFEIGSGNSTKFARRAIKDYSLKTRVTSFDPQPRAEIESICDRAIRQPVEKVDLDIFDDLKAGDILFVDNSHRIFTNSDVAVVFLDILPNLSPGVLVHFHDIFLPFDYPPDWNERYYSEQYMLAMYLLSGAKCEVLLPNFFVLNDQELRLTTDALWPSLSVDPSREGAMYWKNGVSFWILT